jgi:hypothetical protein|tara:strand:+ start:146 stop:487 length:342 start_codon:yes stop_codon:yes gene_type:complete
MSRRKYSLDTHKILSFFVEPKDHEDLKIRLYYDSIKTQSDFFNMCIKSYLDQNELFMKFVDDYKVENSLQSKTRALKATNERLKGKKLMKDLALSEDEIEDIFDLLEEDLPEI